MPRVTQIATLTLVLLTALGLRQAPAAGKAGKAPAGPVQITVLRMTPTGTLWRYHETWRTDVARLDSGKLIRVDPLDPRTGFSSPKIWKEQRSGRNPKTLQFPLRPATQIAGSSFPSPSWRAPDFDDGAWVRTASPMRVHYRSLAMICLRGKFRVIHPAKVTELALAASIQGGAVFYLNGQEIGRTFMPKGTIDAETLAEDYPIQAFVGPAGTPFGFTWYPGRIMSEKMFCRRVKDAELQKRYKIRFRKVNLKIPPAALRRGVNVLAVEAHRAPAREAMFTRVNPKQMGYNLLDHRGVWWNRVSVESLELTATAVAGAVVGNAARPASIQAWNWPVCKRVTLWTCGDPTEPLRPIRLCGARNGAFAGQVVVSAPKPFKGLTAKVTALTGPGGRTLGGGAVRLRYPRWYARHTIGFDALAEVPPAEVGMLRDRYGPKAAIQPIWLTVRVPADATPGDYSGTMTVRTESLEPVNVPIKLHVSDYALPDSKDFVTHMGFVQSPDTLAIRYKVPMWSEAHWKLIDRSFQVLGMLSTKEITVPLIRKTHFGNEHAMLWWVKQDDGSLKPDVRIIQKYVDVAVKHLGRAPMVIFYVSEGEEGRTIPWITEFDPTTGELKESKAPRWGTAKARAFWKPAFDALGEILTKKGMADSLTLGYHADRGNGPECAKVCIADIKALAPKARWIRLGHFWFGHQRLEKGPNGNPWARVGLVGNYGVFWEPGKDRPFYGWRNPHVVTAYTRGVFHAGSPLRYYRLCPEAILLTGRRKAIAGWGICDFAGMFGRKTFGGMRGFAPWGGDFWPVLKGRRGYRDIIARYNDPSAAQWDPRSSWSTVQLNNFQVTYVVGDGADGPVSSVRAEILREGLQEAEARVFVQNALLDNTRRAKLGDDLAKRAELLCDGRTRALRHISEFSIVGTGKAGWPTHYILDLDAWRDSSRQLYEMAAEVATALGRK